jgi:5-methyltetrahydropteroyltriglutamate--homocysteine methyltransferase
MDTLVDDIGSFPLPSSVSRKAFEISYKAARDAIREGKNLDSALNAEQTSKVNYREIVLDSFRKKLKTGLDVVNYPQQYDAVKQVGDLIHKAMGNGTFVVEDEEAFFPEIFVISQESKRLFEEFGKKILLRVSLFGPMEQYLKEIGTASYHDVLDGFAETIRRFAKNSIIDTKYLKTEVVSIDEPSFGFLNINAEGDLICKTLNKAFNFRGATRQIHLHSSTKLPDLLCIENIDVFSFEYAASPKNIEGISKKMFERMDKRIRIGISRTDIDSILAELSEKGIFNPSDEQLVESQDTIRRRFMVAKEKFGDFMSFTGPDCGLGSWPNQQSAQLLLRRTVESVKGAS